MKSWHDTTRFIAGMDFVVTVDTAVAHLAGLLGVPTLILVPLCADWKFATGQHLYGPHVKIFRNTKFEWEVDRICAAIKEMRGSV